MEFRILGPLEVLSNGRPVAVGAAKPRALLAILLIRSSEPVSSDRLIDDLWAGKPPATAAKVLQAYISSLRKALGGQTIVTGASGYELRIEYDALDSHRFERLVVDAGEADAAAQPNCCVRRFGLWRGPALVDFAFEPWARAEIARLEELRLDALHDRIDADLELGRATALVAELEALVAEHPLRERLRGQLMLALYRASGQADALDAFRAARETLVQQLGIEPGRELRRLERAILEQDSSLDVDAVARPVAVSSTPGHGSPRAGNVVRRPERELRELRELRPAGVPP